MQTFVKIKIVHRLTCVQLRLIRKEKIRKRLNEPRFLCVSPFYATQLVLLPWLPLTLAHIAQQPHFLSTSCLYSEPLCDTHKNHSNVAANEGNAPTFQNYFLYSTYKYLFVYFPFFYKDMLALILNHILVNNKQLQTRRTTKLYSHLKIVRKQKILSSAFAFRPDLFSTLVQEERGVQWWLLVHHYY